MKYNKNDCQICNKPNAHRYIIGWRVMYLCNYCAWRHNVLFEEEL